MNKESMILLIESFEALDKLDNYITGLTGNTGLQGSPFDKIFNIARVISINSSFYDPDNEDGAFNKCMETLRNEKLSVEEKCNLLIGTSSF